MLRKAPAAVVCMLVGASVFRSQDTGLELHPIERAKQSRQAGTQPLLAQAAAFIEATTAKSQYHLSGKGLTAVVIDTGIRATHFDFCGRVAAQRNFTDAGPADTAADGEGHGTNVAGIIAARDQKCASGSRGRHQGIAHDAGLIALKVVKDNRKSDMKWLDEALAWVLARVKAETGTERIGVVNISLGLRRNESTDADLLKQSTALTIKSLRDLRVAVVVAAGNDYGVFGGNTGMAIPAIVRWTTSVGAVFDADIGAVDYGPNGSASATRAGQIAPFSQRVPRLITTPAGPLDSVNPVATDIFAPGATILATGILDDASHSEQEGTSQAAPMVAGSILLLQEFYLRETRSPTLPSVDDIEAWLREGSIPEKDEYGETDTVANTGKDYPRLNVLRSVEGIKQSIKTTKAAKK